MRWDNVLLGNVADVDRWLFCEWCGKPLQVTVEGRFDSETGAALDGLIMKYCPLGHTLVTLSKDGPLLPRGTKHTPITSPPPPA